MFLPTAALFAFAAAVEALLLFYQKEKKLLTNRFGKNAFPAFAVIVSILWAAAFASFLALQFEPHSPLFSTEAIEWLGVLIAIASLFIMLPAFCVLGWKRTLNIRFFERGWDKAVKKFPYSFLQDPMYIGGVLFLFGFALWTDSFYNLALAVEVGVLLDLLSVVENEGLKR